MAEAQNELPELPSLEEMLPDVDFDGSNEKLREPNNQERIQAMTVLLQAKNEADLEKMIPAVENRNVQDPSTPYDGIDSDLAIRKFTFPNPTLPPSKSSRTDEENHIAPSIKFQSFFHTMLDPLPETRQFQRLEQELATAEAFCNMKKLEAQYSMYECQAAKAQIYNVANEPLVADEDLSGENCDDEEIAALMAEREAALHDAFERYQCLQIEFDAKKLDLLAAEVNVDTAKERIKTGQMLEVKAQEKRIAHIDTVTRIVGDYKKILNHFPRTVFFACNCKLYGLMPLYVLILTRTRPSWKEYPSEKWFKYLERKAGGQVYCPLANIDVDLCDQSMYSKNACVFSGNLLLSDKLELAEALVRAKSSLQPPSLFVRADGTIDDGSKDNTNARKNVHQAMSDMIERHEKIWFLKNSRLDYGKGITVLKSPKEYGHYIKAGEKYVLQPHILNPLLYFYDNHEQEGGGGHKFHVRLYFCLYTVKEELKLIVFQQGWLAIAKKPFSQPVEDCTESLEHANLSRDRSLPWSTWQHYAKSFKILTDATRRCVRVLKPKLKRIASQTERKRKKTAIFELFGADYIFDEKFKPYIIEINAGPLCKESEHPMIEKMLNIVLPQGVQEEKRNVHSAHSQEWKEISLS